MSARQSLLLRLTHVAQVGNRPLMPVAITPRIVVLNAVRVALESTTSIRQLLQIGELFAFNANAVRVAVTRLVADGHLESDERGSYRLGGAAQESQAHVESWRLGESRIRPWKGEWLAVVFSRKSERSLRRTSLHALSRFGLREGLPGVWVRPDNLRQPRASSVERLRGLGLEDGAEVFRATDFGDALVERFRSELWPIRSLSRSYESVENKLARSLAQLDHMPREKALVQTFLFGGEAIRVLATDPLLPEQMLACEPRAKLTRTMLHYDEVGRALWKRFASEPELESVASHPRARGPGSQR